MEMSEIRTLKASDENSGLRLDAFIPKADDTISRNFAQILISQGAVNVNGTPELSKKKKIFPGDTVTLELPDPEPLEAEPQNIPIEIVYEDQDLIVVNKPQGMVVHPAPGNPDGTLVNALLYHCGNSLSSINGVIRPGIVHRIDKDTSGLLMAAKNDQAHESLALQLREHSVTRRYTALVFDNIQQDSLTIDQPIGRDYNNRMKRCVGGSNMKEAVTHVRVLERFGGYTLVSCVLETGRTHQIRVHMSYIKHPLVGDPLYGPKNRKVPFQTSGQMLHAGVLGFVHPRTGEYMEFSVPLPEEFQKAVDVLEKRRPAGDRLRTAARGN